MATKPKICWIADVPGWAYDNRRRAVAARMPGYAHSVVFDVVRRTGDAFMSMSEADVVVCPDPRVLPFVPGRRKVVLNLNAIKLFKGIMTN